jgi:hypothetical protein
MSGPVVVAELPDFDNPPVIEIVAAAQFVALPWRTWSDPDGLTGLFIFDDHRTGRTLDGELPDAEPRLVEALLRIQRG